MKIKISITDDSGKEYGGAFNILPQNSSTTDKLITNQRQMKNGNYKGLSGGITFLMDQNFFDTPKSAIEVHADLKRERYYHSLQSVDAALRNNFVSRNKTLTRIKEDKVWKYVIRR